MLYELVSCSRDVKASHQNNARHGRHDDAHTKNQKRNTGSLTRAATDQTPYLAYKPLVYSLNRMSNRLLLLFFSLVFFFLDKNLCQ